MKVAIVLFAVFAIANAGSLKCEACKFVVGRIQGFLKNDQSLTNQTVNLVENDICSLLPEQYKDLCDAGVAAYLPGAIAALEDKFLDPEFACTSELHLCESSEMLRSSMVGSDLECQLCQLATAWVAQEMQTNTSEAFIEKELDNVCNLLPSSIASLCDSIVQQQGPAVIAKIAGLVQADVCTAIHMCQAKVSTNGFECELCEAVLGQVQQFIETNPNISLKIETVLEDDVCTRLPQSIQALCNSTVVAETPDIIKAIAQKALDPTTDCTALNLCTPSTAFGVSGNDLKCTICQAATNFLDKNVFESQSVDALVVKELETICGLLPSQYTSLCDQAVEASAPGVMTMIGQFLATKACADIHAC